MSTTQTEATSPGVAACNDVNQGSCSLVVGYWIVPPLTPLLLFKTRKDLAVEKHRGNDIFNVLLCF